MVPSRKRTCPTKRESRRVDGLKSALRKGYVILPWRVWHIGNPAVNMGVSKNNGTSKWMVKTMENPMNKWMIWGKTPYFWFNTHISRWIFQDVFLKVSRLGFWLRSQILDMLDHACLTVNWIHATGKILQHLLYFDWRWKGFDKFFLFPKSQGLLGFHER